MGIGLVPLASAAAYAESLDDVVEIDQVTADSDSRPDVAPARALVTSASLDMAQFDPGFLIADHQFFDGDAMTEAEIQAFLDSKGRSGSACTTTYWCLDNLTVPTVEYAPSPRCDGYAASDGEPVARVIYKVQVSCNISAKVILVTLDKEQGLISRSWLRSSTSDTQSFNTALSRAMGYACPDTAPCDPGSASFHRQVMNGAAQFQRYRLNPNGYTFQPGAEYIQYNPNPACGGSVVNIRNQATAGLYNYTPYQPNSAAVAAYPGTAPCGAYGNRNFWAYYTAWFGDPRTYEINASASRIDGVDRYNVAARVATEGYPSGTSTVYVANGLNFPDGLVSAPAAARAGAPLLLTDPATLPTSTAQAIQTLGASNIVVVGGVNSVSEQVYSQLQSLVPGGSIRRDAGLDRFSAALEIARQGFDSAPVVYLANGLNFPDALSTAAAAGAEGAPILLVRPWDTELDAATRALLDELGTTSIVIAGGPVSVSSALESWLTTSSTVASVQRLSGADRFSAGLAVNQAAFPTASHAYVASGITFPDAMAAAAVAAATGRPLLLSPGWCTPLDTLRYFESAGVDRIDFLGGINTLSPRTITFEVCS